MSGSQEFFGRPGIPFLRTAMVLFLLFAFLPAGLQAQEEDEEEVVFKGIGIHVRLGGGYSLFSGGDLKSGIQGMYDQACRAIAGAGYSLGRGDEHPLNSGYELGGEIVYYFAGRLGLGAGGTLARAKKTNKQLFRPGNDPRDYSLTIVPQVDLLSLRLAVFYAIPLNRLLTVSVNVGPAYYSVDYEYAASVAMVNYEYDHSQNAKAGGFGAQGGVGFEIRMNERLAFILEARGRYAKISGFEGKEGMYEYLGGPFATWDKKGKLYYFEEEGFPRLEVFAQAPTAGSNSREAVFDFSGVSLRAGLNFKF